MGVPTTATIVSTTGTGSSQPSEVGERIDGRSDLVDVVVAAVKVVLISVLIIVVRGSAVRSLMGAQCCSVQYVWIGCNCVLQMDC